MTRTPRRTRAQGLVELALLLPILFTIFFGILDFSYYMFVSVSVVNGTRTAVRRAVMNNKTKDEIKGLVVMSCPGVVISSNNIRITTFAADASRPDAPPTVEVMTVLQHKFFCSALLPIDTLKVKSVHRGAVVTTPDETTIQFAGDPPGGVFPVD